MTVLDGTSAGPVIAPGERFSHRPDIQGLRALAVGLVVAFHAGLPIPGGFVGVDVFFVISGFVITAMLMRQKANAGRVSFARFYGRRFLRLTPALALLVTVVALASLVLQGPFGAQQTTASTGLGAMLLVANVVISHASGDYFADAATTNPLLNTWSLSVEEQFYLVFPGLLVLGWFLARKTRLGPLVLVVALACASFLLSIVTTYSTATDQLSWFGGPLSFAYFSSLTRAWEFAVGAILALCLARIPILRRAHLVVLSSAGVLLLIAASLLLSDSTPFPGVAALLPVLGAALLLFTGSQGTTLTGRVLASRPLVAVGDASYSWYLWHWPVIVFAVLLWPDRPLVAVIAAIGSLVPAVLSYRFVENPLRRLQLRAQWRRVLVGVGTLAPPLVMCLALLLGANSGWGLIDATDTSTPSQSMGVSSSTVVAQVSPDAAGDDTPMSGGLRSDHIAIKAGCVNVPLTVDTCVFGPAHAPQILLAGDSQAYAVADGVIAAATSLGYSTQVASRTGCPFLGLPSSGTHDIPCQAWQSDVLAYAKAHRPAMVIIANRSTGYVHPEIRWRTVARPDGGRASSITEATALYRTALSTVLTHLSSEHIPVIVLNAVPDMKGYVDRTSLAAQAFGAADFGRSLSSLALQREPAMAVESSLASSIAGVSMVDPFPSLCSDRECWARKGGDPWYQDEQHVSVLGALRLEEPIRQAITQAFAR